MAYLKGSLIPLHLQPFTSSRLLYFFPSRIRCTVTSVIHSRRRPDLFLKKFVAGRLGNHPSNDIVVSSQQFEPVMRAYTVITSLDGLAAFSFQAHRMPRFQRDLTVWPCH